MDHKELSLGGVGLEGEELFHYTSTSNFRRIIKNNQLTATHSDHLNDVTEVRHGVDLAKEILKERLDQADNALMGEFLSLAHERLEEEKSEHDVFTFSLSTEGDQLSQWQAYGKGGQGYSLGFQLEGQRVEQPQGTSVFLTKVVYKREDKVEEINETITRWAEEAQAADDLGDLPAPAGKLAENLLLKCASFKDPSFQTESEVRIVVVVYDDKDDLTNFRTSDSSLVPQWYLNPIDIWFQSVGLPLSSVVVGPGRNYESQLPATADLLRVHGHEIEPEKSTVPLR